MEEIRKQTVSRIAEFFNGESTNAEVDTYKKLLDFEKEVKQQFSLPDVSHRRELYFAFMQEYNTLMGKSEHQILKEEVVVLLAKYSG